MPTLRRTSIVAIWCCAAGVVLLAGCGSSHQPCSVAGRVEFNGKPIESGAIRFVTHDKTPGLGGIAPISDGKYAITTEGMFSGKYLVMISGFRKTGRVLKIDGNEVEEKLQYVPSKYNTNATEVLELEPGDNARDFQLTP